MKGNIPNHLIIKDFAIRWISTYLFSGFHIFAKLVGWLGFYGISTFVGYLTPNPFYANNHFCFKQVSLAWVHSVIVKTFLFPAIQFIQTVLIQLIQFNISTDFE